MIHNKEEDDESSGTFIGRLIDVSKKNSNFTIEDVYAETATILTAVLFFKFNMLDQIYEIF